MKIAYMPFSPQFTKYAETLLRILMDKHDVRIFTTHALPPSDDPSYLQGFNITYGPWSWLDLKELYDFNPDLIIMWNGYAPWTYAAMKWLKKRYPMLHMERGWLPQKDHLYMADDLAPHSKFIMGLPEVIPTDHSGIERLKQIYKPSLTDHTLPEKFIFVPAQLDEDTSIVISSPLFKTCDSFIGALRHYIPDVPIIVKNHPVAPNKSRPPNVTVYDGPLSSLDLCAQATVVAGITSTVLTEALVYGKPVASFGYNVGMQSHIKGSWCDHLDNRCEESVWSGRSPKQCRSKNRRGEEELFTKIRSICLEGAEVSVARPAEKTLSWLLGKQWRPEIPPQWLLDYIKTFPIMHPVVP